MFSKRFLRILDGLSHLHSLFAYFRRAFAPTFVFLRFLGALAYLHRFFVCFRLLSRPCMLFAHFLVSWTHHLQVLYMLFCCPCRRNRILLRFFCRTGLMLAVFFVFCLFLTRRARPPFCGFLRVLVLSPCSVQARICVYILLAVLLANVRGRFLMPWLFLIYPWNYSEMADKNLAGSASVQAYVISHRLPQALCRKLTLFFAGST